MLNAHAQEVAPRDPIEDLEAHMLSLPQVECSVKHHFGPNLYIREVTIPGGTFAIGQSHRHEHLNVLLTGAIALLNDRGELEILRAPITWVGKSGRKVAYIIETVAWQNIFSTPERDVNKLDEMLVDKSDVWKEHHDRQHRLLLEKLVQMHVITNHQDSQEI